MRTSDVQNILHREGCRIVAEHDIAQQTAVAGQKQIVSISMIVSADLLDLEGTDPDCAVLRVKRRDQVRIHTAVLIAEFTEDHTRIGRSELVERGEARSEQILIVQNELIIEIAVESLVDIPRFDRVGGSCRLEFTVRVIERELIHHDLTGILAELIVSLKRINRVAGGRIIVV